jgi:sRNA-binding carbon storage regulator CsrA
MPGYLVLNVKEGGSVYLNDAEVKISHIGTGQVVLAIRASRDIRILRGVLYHAQQSEQGEVENG